MKKTDSLSFAIILYDSRSGSTFLSSQLNQYKGCRVAVESAFPRILLEYSKSIFSSPEELEGVLDAIYSEIQFQEMKINRKELIDKLEKLGRNLSKQDIFNSIINLYFKELDFSCKYILKIPVAHGYLDTLESLIPNYKIIHLVRDGRAVFSSKRHSISLRGKPFETNLLAAAFGWKKKIQLAALCKLPIINIKYEELIKNTDNVMEELLNFLDIDYDNRLKTKDMDDFALSIGEKQKSFHKNIGKAPQIGNINKWQRDLREGETLLYEVIAKRKLIDYNYNMIYLRKKLDLTIMLCASLYAFIYVFEYILGRVKNVSSHLVTGSFSKVLRRKLIQNNIVKIKI